MVRICCLFAALALLVSTEAMNLKGGFGKFQVRKRTPPSEGGAGFVEIAEAPPKFLEARQFGQVLLQCAASGSPAPEITWFKDGRPIQKQSYSKLFDPTYTAPSSMSESKSELSLSCVSEADAGLYECVATSKGTKASVATEVNVASFGSAAPCSFRSAEMTRTPPSIYQWMVTYLQLIGTDARLTCRAQGHHSTTWVGPNNEVITEGNGKFQVLETGDLLIHDISFDEMGVFKCFAKNEFGEDMKETFVYPHAA